LGSRERRGVPSRSHQQAKRNGIQAIEKVSRALGNTPTICRQCHIFPEVPNAYLSGDLAVTIDEETDSELKPRFAELHPDELRVMVFLHKRLKAMRTSA
jgi:DNA topoisomerase I